MAEFKFRGVMRAASPDLGSDYIAPESMMYEIQETVRRLTAEFGYELVELEFQEPYDHRERKTWHKVRDW